MPARRALLRKGRFALWSKVRELAELPTLGLGARATGWPEQTHSVPKPWGLPQSHFFPAQERIG